MNQHIVINNETQQTKQFKINKQAHEFCEYLIFVCGIDAEVL